MRTSNKETAYNAEQLFWHLLPMQLTSIPVTEESLLYTEQTFSLPIALLVGQLGLFVDAHSQTTS